MLLCDSSFLLLIFVFCCVALASLLFVVQMNPTEMMMYVHAFLSSFSFSSPWLCCSARLLSLLICAPFLKMIVSAFSPVLRFISPPDIILIGLIINSFLLSFSILRSFDSFLFPFFHSPSFLSFWGDPLYFRTPEQLLRASASLLFPFLTLLRIHPDILFLSFFLLFL